MRTSSRQAVADKQKERLDYALQTIRDHGGCISRKQLTEILVKKFNLERDTVSKFISCQVLEKKLFEANKNISSSPEMTLPL